MPADEKIPEFTVVVPVRGDAAPLRRCLRALAFQEGDFDVLVVDSSDAPIDWRRDFPGVRFLRSERSLAPGAARNLGVRASRGRGVVFLDARCEAPQGWAAGARAALARGGIVGGSRRLAVEAGYWGRVQYAIDFSDFAPTRSAGRAPFVPAGNSALAREAALGRPFDERALAAEDVAWGRDAEVRFEPAWEVLYHPREGAYETLLHCYRRGLESARARRRLGLRGGRLAGRPALAWTAYFYRMARVAPRAGAALLPGVALGLLAWTAGFMFWGQAPRYFSDCRPQH